MRKALNMSQAKLAEKARVSMHTILRLETGKQRPQKSNLLAIAKVLGCSVESLYIDHTENLKTPTAASSDAQFEAIKEATKEAIKEYLANTGLADKTMDYVAIQDPDVSDLITLVKRLKKKQLKHAKFMLETLIEDGKERAEPIEVKKIRTR